MNTVWVELQKTTITSQITTKSLRSGKLSFGKEILGFSHKEVGNHFLRAGFSIEIFLVNMYPETIMIMG